MDLKPKTFEATFEKQCDFRRNAIGHVQTADFVSVVVNGLLLCIQQHAFHLGPG